MVRSPSLGGPIRSAASVRGATLAPGSAAGAGGPPFFAEPSLFGLIACTPGPSFGPMNAFFGRVNCAASFVANVVLIASIAVSTTMRLNRSSRVASSYVSSATQKSYATHLSPLLSASSCGWPRVCGTLHCTPPGRFSLVAGSHFSLWQMFTNAFAPVVSSRVFAANPGSGAMSCTPAP